MTHTQTHTYQKNISSNNPVTLNQEYATHPHPLKFCCVVFFQHIAVLDLWILLAWPGTGQRGMHACLGDFTGTRPPPPREFAQQRFEIPLPEKNISPHKASITPPLEQELVFR